MTDDTTAARIARLRQEIHENRDAIEKLQQANARLEEAIYDLGHSASVQAPASDAQRVLDAYIKSTLPTKPKPVDRRSTKR